MPRSESTTGDGCRGNRVSQPIQEGLAISLFDQIKQGVSAAFGSVSASALPGLINRHYPGGLNGVLQQLQQNGYGQQVASWLGHGLYDPITAQDVERALNNDHVKQVAQQMGVLYDQMLQGMAKALPEVVDRHSPDSQLQPPPAPNA